MAMCSDTILYSVQFHGWIQEVANISVIRIRTVVHLQECTVVQPFGSSFSTVACSALITMKVPVDKRVEYNKVISKSRISPFIHRWGRRGRIGSYGSATKCRSIQKRKIHAVTGVKCSTRRKMASAQLQMGSQQVQQEGAVLEVDRSNQQQQQVADKVMKTPGKTLPKTPAKNQPKTPGKVVSKTPGKRNETVKKNEDGAKKRKASVSDLAAARRKDKVEVEMKGIISLSL